jgi:hypothetical protein
MVRTARGAVAAGPGRRVLAGVAVDARRGGQHGRRIHRAVHLRPGQGQPKKYSPEIAFNRRMLHRKAQKIQISSPKVACPIKLGLRL